MAKRRTATCSISHRWPASRSYEPTELVVTVRAGTPIAELEAALAEHGQCLAFEPPRFERADTPVEPRRCAARWAAWWPPAWPGPSRAAVGGVRDFVLGAALLNGRGEVLRFGGEVMKNVAGYDVSRLLAGSLGILGPILEVSLKVLPIPPARTTLRFEWPQAQALRAAAALGRTAVAAARQCVVERHAGGAARRRRRRGARGQHRRSAATSSTPRWPSVSGPICATSATISSPPPPQAVKAGATLWRVSVAPHAPPLAVAGEQLIEWHGGQRWIVNESDAPTMRALAAAAGGHATAFRGAQGAAACSAPLSAPLQRIHRELKARFDPDRLFNPGRLYPDL